MTYRLSHEGYRRRCPYCRGQRKVPAPNQRDSAGNNLISNGFPIPCPECRGRGWVLGAVESKQTDSSSTASKQAQHNGLGANAEPSVLPLEEQENHAAASAAGVPQGTRSADLYYEFYEV